VSKVCAQTGGEAEDTERRERESPLEKNGMEEPLEEAAQNARNILRSKEAECICTLTPFSSSPKSALMPGID
jgi:hypothetical protein